MYAHAYYFKYYYNIEYSNLKVGYILYIFGEFRVEKIMCILENLQKKILWMNSYKDICSSKIWK